MVTLKELIKEYQEVFGYSDEEIIEKWFVNNEREDYGIDLICELASVRMKKYKDIIRKHQWLAFSKPNLYGKQTKQIRMAGVLDEFERRVILGEDVDYYKEKLAEICPQVSKPSLYFKDAYDKIKDWGIKFKDESDF